MEATLGKLPGELTPRRPLFGLVLASELGGYLSPRFGRVNSEAISLHQLSPPSHIWLSKSKTKTPGQESVLSSQDLGTRMRQEERDQEIVEPEQKVRGGAGMDHGFGKPGGWLAPGDHLVQSPHCHMGRLKLKKAEN